MLQDTQQVLFRSCGFKRDDHVCQEPTLNVFENATCVFHITLPAQPHNNLAMVCFCGSFSAHFICTGNSQLSMKLGGSGTADN